MPRIHILIVSIGMFAIGCNNHSTSEATNRKNGYEPVLKTKEDSLYHDVMQGHDAGMAKTGKLRKNIDEVKNRLDSISKLPAAKVNALYKESLIQLQKQLNDANNEMNTWMDEFKVDSAANNPDMRIKYLQQEKEKVTLVKQHILTSLQTADSLLNKK